MTSLHATRHFLWAPSFSHPSLSNLTSVKVNHRRSTSTVGLFNLKLQNTSTNPGQQRSGTPKELDIVEALRLPFGQIRRLIKNMMPVPSSNSNCSDRSPLLCSQLDDSLTWANESYSTYQGDTEAKHLLRSRPPPQLPNQGQMTPASTYQVLHRIGQTFCHVQYAVCGAAAMVAYGNNACRCTHVSIVCPAYAGDVIKSWAAATSDMLVYPGEPDIIGIADNDGDVWMVKIKPIPYDGRFETLSAVDMGFGADRALTKILTMPALVNRIAAAYVLGVGGSAAEEVCLDDVAGDLTWLLSRICEDDRPEQQLTSQGVPAIRSPEFWIDFTSAHPGLPGLFYDAGLRAGVAESARPQVEPEDSPLRDGGSGLGRKRRATAGFNLGLHRRRRERPNMTRAEARKILSDPPFWRRSSGQIFRRRREIEGSLVGEPMSGFGTRVSHFLFGESRKPTTRLRGGSDDTWRYSPAITN